MFKPLICEQKPSGRDINISVVGFGKMGKGLFHQSLITPGIKCVAIGEIRLENAVQYLDFLKINYRVAASVKDVNNAIKDGVLAVCEDGALIAASENIDALIEASSSVDAAGRISIQALESRKHLIMMNSEADLIFGPYLASVAKEEGIVYTSCGGDQHTVLSGLIRDIKLWGFELVMAGNIKGFLDRAADPDTVILEADKRDLSYDMCSAMTDGTKLNIEMSLLANAFDLSPLVKGMSGPACARVEEVPELFDLKKIWEAGTPFVDYILGAEPGGGVFVVAYCDDPYQKKMLRYYKMGEGPFYLFYRHFHLCHIEAMASVLNAFLRKEPALKPDFGFRTNVYAYAKRPLYKGEKLDGIGKFTCFGLIENSDDGQNPGLPICLADNVALKRDINKNDPISFDDIQYDPKEFKFETYRRALKCPKAI